MAGHLILVEWGADVTDALSFIREQGLDERSGTLVFSERDLSGLEHEMDFKTQCIMDRLPLHGEESNQIFIVARALTQLIGNYLSESPYSDALHFEDFYLWELASYEAELIVRRALRRIIALDELLSVRDWTSVYSFETTSALWRAFSALIDVESEVDSVERYTARAWGARIKHLKTKAVPNWSDQLIRDVYWGVKSRPVPRLRPLLPTSAPYLFIVNGYHTYFSTIEPVIRRVAADSEVILLTQGGVVHAAGLEKLGVRPTYCTQYILPLRWPRIMRHTRKLCHAWRKLRDEEEFRSLLHYRGNRLWPTLSYSLHKLFVELLPRLVMWLEALGHLYSAARPRVVVAVPDRHGIARSALALAQHYVIPSVAVQPALISDSPRYGPMFADKIAAIDQYSRQIYLKRGKVESQRIAVTGLPRWDSMIEALREWRFRSLEDKERTRTNLLAQLHLDVEEDVQLVLFAAQNLPFSHTWEMLEPLLKSLAAFQNTLLVVKVHPADSLSVAEYEQQFASLNLHGCRVVVVNEIRLPTLLAHSEVVVTGFSNVALEAALLDKPVLIVNLTGRPDPLPFVSNGIALGAYTESEAREKLTGLLTNSQVTEALRIRREEYFRQNPQLMDGRATERVVNLLHEIAAPPRQGVK